MELSENHLGNDLRLMCDCQQLAIRKISGPSAKNAGKPYYTCNQVNRCKFFEFEENSKERLRNLGVIEDSNPSPLLFNMSQPNAITPSSTKRKISSLSRDDDDDEISFWTSAPKNKDAGRSLFENKDITRSTYSASNVSRFQQTPSGPGNANGNIPLRLPPRNCISASGMKYDSKTKTMELSRAITDHMSRQDRLLLASNKRIKFLLNEWNRSKEEIQRQKKEIDYLKNRIQEMEDDHDSISQQYANELYKNKIDLVASNTYNTQLLKSIDGLKNLKDLEISRLSQVIINYEKQIKDDVDQINNLVTQNNHLADCNRRLLLVTNRDLTSSPTNLGTDIYNNNPE